MQRSEGTGRGPALAAGLPIDLPGRARPSRRRERGTAMAEFALIMPLFLLILFAVVDFGRAYSVYVTITNASREGARLGITGATSAQIVAQAQTAAGSYNDAHLTVSVSNAQCGSNCDIVVTTQYKLTFITPIAAIAKLVPGTSTLSTSITLTSSSDMRSY